MPPAAVIARAAWGLALACLAAPACGDTASGGCQVTVSALNFGSYDPQDPRPNDSAGAAVIACSGMGSSPLTLALLAGSGHAATFADRVLRAGAQELSYNLYSDPARQQIWGDGTGGHAPITVSIADPSAPVRVNFYGRIAARQNVGPAVYQDTILVTLVF